MCTRVLYETGAKTFMVGRSMDWNDMQSGADWWVFPRGMARNGGVGAGSITWTSKYGSVVVSIYQLASCDGINEAGLVGNMLYLAESEYGDASTNQKPKLSLGAWLQYVLDNFATVADAVTALQADAPVPPTERRGQLISRFRIPVVTPRFLNTLVANCKYTTDVTTRS